jgi:hypothetical protein
MDGKRGGRARGGTTVRTIDASWRPTFAGPGLRRCCENDPAEREAETMNQRFDWPASRDLLTALCREDH